MRRPHFTILFVLATLTAPALAAEMKDLRKLKPVQFTDVKITDDFFAPRIEINRKTSIPHNLDWCEKTGRINNFAKSGKLMEGQFQGIYYDDSDLYKVLEGASYSLAQKPDPDLERRLDDIIAKIAAAQHPDGYINTYYTLKEPGRRWTNLKDMHELYCGGHLIEAAVAHHRATGKRNLLDVAVKFADHADSVFGPDKRHDVCGHEEIELALIKLYHLTGNQKYFKLAQFFLDMRGNGASRQKLYGDYCQDHQPVREQQEIVGHAVRAMYLYSAVADAAAITRDNGFLTAMDAVWNDVTLKKMYVTGGIGPSAHNEGFTVAYDLPNETAYAETCAAIGMALWSHRLNLLHADARYFDVLERALYNGLLSGVSLDGTRFFYVNPLASKGNHHRKPWFGTACCPTNMARLLPSVSGYVYATDDQGLYVNLFVASEASIDAPAGGKVVVKQETSYPWEGSVKVNVARNAEWPAQVKLRVPGWARHAKISLNGLAVEAKPQNGYATVPLTGAGQAVIALDLPMPVERVRAHPLAKANVGRIAVQRGPIVYCLEGADNKNANVSSLAIPDDAKLTPERRPDLLAGVTVIKTTAEIGDPATWNDKLYSTTSPRTTDVTFIPYCTWDNRAPGQMIVWLPTDPQAATRILPKTIAGQSKPSASHCFQNDTVEALNDQIDPRSSDDHSIRRFTWWPRTGSTEWAQYDLPTPTKISSCEVYWFQDTGGCRLPQSWKLQYRDGDTWKDVEGTSDYGVKANDFNKVTFTPVTTSALRLVVNLRERYSGGILEWKVGA